MDISKFNQSAGYNVSGKYVAINTAQIVSQFEAAGFVLNRISVARVLKAEKQGFQKHLLVFRRNDMLERGGYVPEIILKNSFDGSSSYQLLLGIYRLVCANGLMVGETFSSVRVRHVGSNVVERAIEGAYQVLKQANEAAAHIDAMKSTQLTDFEAYTFAKNAANILQLPESATVDVSSLLRARRPDDLGQDLWTVFNRVQENIVRGGLRYTTVNRLGRTVNRTRRSIRAIDASISVNRKLWTLAETFVNAA